MKLVNHKTYAAVPDAAPKITEPVKTSDTDLDPTTVLASIQAIVEENKRLKTELANALQQLEDVRGIVCRR